MPANAVEFDGEIAIRVGQIDPTDELCARHAVVQGLGTENQAVLLTHSLQDQLFAMPLHAPSIASCVLKCYIMHYQYEICTGFAPM